MSIFNKLAAGLQAKGVPVIAKQMIDTSCCYIEISKIDQDRESEIAATLIFDLSGEILEDVTVHERPGFDTERETQLL